MRILISLMALALVSCGQGQAHPYPEAAHAEFNRSCPPSDAVCACTWESLTHRLAYEEYDAAMRRFRSEGLMDPRITRARTECIERSH
ncbi:MAG: hypothetical protein AB7J28_02175 [Hyphomonadaceae bacterium]